MRVTLNTDFPVSGSDYYTPAASEVPASDLVGSPSLPQPLGWAPSPTLTWPGAPSALALSFSEPASWSRFPWHLPPTPDGFYVPVLAANGTYGWHGAGPWTWGYTIDGTFHDTSVQAGPPGGRTSISIPFDTADPATGQPYDWTQPHTFTLHLLYEDVPRYQWWAWDGTYSLAVQGTYESPFWFFPQDRFRATSFPDGYPAGLPDQPVLPPGLTSLDYGGLGPTEVGHEVLQEGDRVASALAFTNHREPGVWLELTSDPYTLSVPAAPSVPVVVNGGTRTLQGTTATVTPLTHAELMTLWVLNGGLQQDADVAAAIAQAESGSCQYAKAGAIDDRPVKACTYRFTTGENSYGLWQINRDAHPQYSAASLYTPSGNARAAVQIAGLPATFGAWTTYTSGAYKQYLQAPQGPFPGPETGTSGGPLDVARTSDRAWNTVNHRLAHDLPSALKEAARVRTTALRRLR